MIIKTSTQRQKHTPPGPDSLNCNSLYGVFKIGLVWLYMAAFYANLVLIPATLLLASVNSTHIGS